MTERPNTNSRLAAVAAAYLQPRPRAAGCIAIAGSDDGVAPSQIAQALLEAAAALPLRARLLDGPQGPDATANETGEPQLWIVVLGRPSTASLARLPAPRSGEGPDLFLWSAGELGLRELYLLGLWSWSLGARATRCIFAAGADAGVRAALARLGVGAEAIRWPNEPMAARQLCLGILQSTLARSARQPAEGARSLQAERG